MLDFATDLLRWGWVVAEATLLILLFRRGLAKRYPLFVAFLIIEWMQMATLLAVNPTTQFYAKCWAASELLVLFALALAAVEVTRKILEHYPFIRDLASSSFAMIFICGAAVSVVLLYPYLDSSSWAPGQLYFVLKVLRWASMTLFAFLAAQVLWFKLFPIKMRRNVALHRWLLALYGGAVPGASVFIYDSYEWDKPARTLINLGMMVTQICLMSAWCLWFTERGEEPVLNPEQRPYLAVQGVNAEGLVTWNLPPGE